MLTMLVLGVFLSLTKGCHEPASGPDESREGDSASEASVHEHLLVSSEWLAEQLEAPGLVVLHVGGDRQGYDEGHIPGSQFVRWEEIAVERDGIANELPSQEALTALVRRLGIDGQSRLVLYDDQVGVAAARGYVTLDYLGLGDRAALLDGQLRQWKAQGRPLSRETPQVVPSAYDPEIREEVVIRIGQMRQLLEGQGMPALIDARSPADFEGSRGGGGIARPGHIPGAQNVPVGGLLMSVSNPSLRPVGELKKTLLTGGIEPGEEVVSYCRTGRSASMTYFVLKYLGYHPRLYDGSFSEWNRHDDLPVARGNETQ